MACARVEQLGTSKGESDALAETIDAEIDSPLARLAIREMMMPNLINGSMRMVHRLSLRRLVHLGVALRLRALEDGRYPASLAGLPEAEGPDPFTGTLLAYRVPPDGSASFEAPGTSEAANELFPADVARRAPVVWTLPGAGPADPR